ncbi:MAG: glycoside hydrolase family 32 protein [Bacilli bacterium]|nr:glycoside hydrolase family 32 protein [Bacilli bacterium]
MISKLLILFTSLLLSLPNFLNKKSVGENYKLTNLDGDDFALVEQSYEASESFVYTSRIHFNEGQACGLVFGAQEDDHYWVFNVDRYDNWTKLIYFYKDGSELKANVVKEERFIGNDKVHESELRVINPALREYGEYNFKVVITKDEDKTFGEFYIDNIKRFGVDNDIDLNSFADITYNGGNLGYNVYRASVDFNEITYGKNDFSYYTELYRNQFHYSQYAHWNNDPNGLVYYQGYYHMYYQTNPFSQQWGPMYWGHARSKDLVHWQELPIALFPDDGDMGVGLGVGYAWSGVAMVYHKGMSGIVDSKGWFPNGDGSGLLGYYTRDGMRQDQVIITSDDGGFTWVKRQHIPQSAAINVDYKVDCRDPSIFPLVKNGEETEIWGMALSGGTQNKIWFLASYNLLDWIYVGELDYIYAECTTVSMIEADDGTTHYALTISSRDYIVGDFYYNPLTGQFSFTKLTDFVKMDYGEDSYAAQCFYIDDTTSKYYGQHISISWNFGLPSDAESGVYAQVRYPWNGGMTIPVALGLRKVGETYKLTQTPITVDNNDFDKTNIVSINNQTFNNETNPLEGVTSHLLEIKSKISNPNKESVEFRVNVSDSEYTAFGWNKDDGYYFDRRNTSDAGINFVKHYHHKFTTGPVDETSLSFYVLVDNGALELFAGEYQYNFYNLTLAAPYSIGASLSSSGEINIDELQVNEMKSIWKEDGEIEDGILYLDSADVKLDMSLLDTKDIFAYSSIGEEINWTIITGEDVISLTETKTGAKVTALKGGEAVIEATSGDNVKTINVTVDDSSFDSPFSLNKEDIYSGTWRIEQGNLIGEQKNGDGYYISDLESSDTTYSVTFDLSSATAGGMLLRASKDMSSYIMFNYDKNEKVSKVWTKDRSISSSNIEVSDTNVILTAKFEGNRLITYVNGVQTGNNVLNNTDPQSGYIGLNVFSGRAVIKEFSIIKEYYEFDNDDVYIDAGVTQYIKNIYNVTKKNELVAKGFYKVEGRDIILSKEYMRLLEDNKTYEFFVEGEFSSFNIKIKTNTINRNYYFFDQTINYGQEVTIYVDTLAINKVTLNGEEITDYYVSDYVLHIDSELFDSEEVEVEINDQYTFTVYVNNIINGPVEVTVPKQMNVTLLIVVIAASVGVVALGTVAFLLIRKKKSHGKSNN